MIFLQQEVMVISRKQKKKAYHEYDEENQEEEEEEEDYERPARERRNHRRSNHASRSRRSHRGRHHRQNKRRRHRRHASDIVVPDFEEDYEVVSRRSQRSRKTINYRFDDYDTAIKTAICDEVEEHKKGLLCGE